MKCAKCGLDLPGNVRNCPKCGTVNEFAAPAAAKQKNPLIYVVIALALVVAGSIVFAGIMAGRARQNVTTAPTGVTPPGDVTAAPPGRPAPGDVVSAPPGAPPPGDTTPPGTPKPKPPQDVVDYLNFVKKVEEHRQMLLKDTTEALLLSSTAGQAQSLLNLIDMASDPEGKEARDPLESTKKELIRQYKNWLDTLAYFDRKPAPLACREFSGAYRQVLYSETKVIGEIATSFSKVNIMDPQDMSRLLAELQKMKRDPSIQANIDQMADNADAKLTQLVSQYDMQKPFSVPREKQTSGSILGF